MWWRGAAPRKLVCNVSWSLENECGDTTQVARKDGHLNLPIVRGLVFEEGLEGRMIPLLLN